MAAIGGPARMRRHEHFAQQNLGSGQFTCPEQVQKTGSPRGLTRGVQVIGTKFVLYRETHSKEKNKRIKLVKA